MSSFHCCCRRGRWQRFDKKEWMCYDMLQILRMIEGVALDKKKYYAGTQENALVMHDDIVADRLLKKKIEFECADPVACADDFKAFYRELAKARIWAEEDDGVL